MTDEGKIVFNFLRIGAFLYREGNRIAGEHELNQQQFVVLRYIADYQPVNQKGIYSHLLFEKSNLSKIIKKLVKLGLIRKEIDKEDGRSNSLYTNAKGRGVIKEVMDKFKIYNTQLFDGFSKREIKKVADTLEMFVHKISK